MDHAMVAATERETLASPLPSRDLRRGRKVHSRPRRRIGASFLLPSLFTTTYSAKMTATAAKILANASKALKIGMMPADGIGREVLPVAQRVLSLTPGAPKFEFIPLPAGFELFTKTGVALPEETIRCLKEECDGAMFGSVSSPSHKVEGYSSPIVQLRKNLDLYANIRPVVGVRGTRDEDKWVDTVIVRENTECLVSQYKLWGCERST